LIRLNQFVPGLDIGGRLIVQANWAGVGVIAGGAPDEPHTPDRLRPLEHRRQHGRYQQVQRRELNAGARIGPVVAHACRLPARAEATLEPPGKLAAVDRQIRANCKVVSGYVDVVETVTGKPLGLPHGHAGAKQADKRFGLRRAKKAGVHTHLRARCLGTQRPDPRDEHMLARLKIEIVGLKEPRIG
jgi:hypothetical protein